MAKNPTPLQLAAFVVIVSTITGLLAFTYGTLLPLLASVIPIIGYIHSKAPYIIDTALTIVVIALGFLCFYRSPSLQRALARSFTSFSILSRILNRANYMADTGFLFLDGEHRILSASKLFIRLSGEAAVEAIQNKRCEEVFSDNFSRLLIGLIEKAQNTRQFREVHISDWSPYCSLDIGPVVIVVTASYEDDQFIGTSVILRSTKEVRLAEESAILHQQNYRALFDNLPLGVAVFRPSVASDGGPDGYLVEANSAYQKTMEGLPLPYSEPCSVMWPSFSQQKELRGALAEIMAGAPIVKVDYFSPALGKHIDVVLAPVPQGRIIVMMSDTTDAKIHERKVLTLTDQLQRTLVKQNEFLTGMLQDTHHFNAARGDLVEFQVERIQNVLPNMPADVAAEVADAVAGLNRSMQQMLRYHDVSTLPFHDTALIQPTVIVSRLVESIRPRFPQVSFETKVLPAVVASEVVISKIIEQLMVSLATLPIIGDAAQIEIGCQSEFLDTGIYVAAWGFDTSQLFVELPTEMQPLDWTYTSDLDLAPIRRKVVQHGGALFLGPTEDGLGVQLTFTIGTPLNPV